MEDKGIDSILHTYLLVLTMVGVVVVEEEEEEALVKEEKERNRSA